MTSLIDRPGLYQISPSVYHADALMAWPTLSSGVAKEFITGSPLHARESHPRLARDYDPASNMEMKRRTAFGSAGHELTLGIHEGDRSLIDVIDAENYSQGKDGVAKSNREKRDASIAAGRFPLLRPQYDEALKVVEAVRSQIDITKAYPGNAEICCIAEVDGVWCRILCDWLTVDDRTIIDLKFTERRLNPSEFNRHAINMGYDLSQGFYRSTFAAWKGVTPEDIDYVFLVVERGPPVVATLMRISERNAEVGLDKARFARQRWKECLETGTWPGYAPPGIIAEGEPVDWDCVQWDRRMQDTMLDLPSSAPAIDESKLMEAFHG